MSTQETDSFALPPALPQWRTVIDDKWETLRRRALGLDSSAPRSLSRISAECGTLTAITAWFEAHGNITQAALRIRTSRRALRYRIATWRKEYPHLVPTPVPIDRSPKHKRQAAPHDDAVSP